MSKQFLLPGALVLLSLSGCAVVTATAMVGSAAVNVATTAVGITYDVSKTVVAGAATTGAYVYNATTASKPLATASATATITPQPQATPPDTAVSTPLHD